MAHSKADVIDSRQAWVKATHDQINVYLGLIEALRNALRGMEMITASVPLNEDDIPAVKGFVKNLADKITAAGNGQ